MDKRQLCLILVAIVAGGLILSGSPAASTVELEDFLFVQNPRGEGAKEGVYVMWVPQVLQKYCIGKTAQQCIDIDYCIRTKNSRPAKCQNLADLPSYPAGMRPARVLGVTYFPAAPIKGLDTVLKYYASKPKDTFDHLSASTRIRAKVKLLRSADDDQFELLEVLAVPLL